MDGARGRREMGGMGRAVGVKYRLVCHQVSL